MPNTPYVDFKAVKASVSMLQILDHYGLTERFKRSGDSLSGSCPLHNGDNPTQFRVSASKNCWNCFGKCKRGGNVLDFVALKENISVREAAIRISEWFGLKFDKPGSRTDSPAAEKNPATTPQSAARSEPVGNNAAETGSNKPLGFQLQNLDGAHPYLTERGRVIVSLRLEGSRTKAEQGVGVRLGCSGEVSVGSEKAIVWNLPGREARWHRLLRNPSPAEAIQHGFKKC